MQKKKTDIEYGYEYPKLGWNRLDEMDRFKRILKFFELTFGYTIKEAIQQATTFAHTWHDIKGNPPIHYKMPESSFLTKFVEEWDTRSQSKPKSQGIKSGGRKTKKKRKKNASPIKTRKVKKQKK